VRSPDKIILLFILTMFSAAICRAEPRLSCALKEISPDRKSLSVECDADGIPSGKAAIRFRHQFAGIDGLSERVYGIRVESGGARVPLEIRGQGLYLAESAGGPLRLTYELRLARVFNPAQYGLVSTLGPQAGIIHPADILPRICPDPASECAETALRLRIDPPPGWKAVMAATPDGGIYDIPHPAETVIYLGPFRERAFSVGAMRVRALIAGTWSFADDEIFTLAETIASDQASMIEGRESGDHIVALAPFPLPLTGLRSTGICIGRSAVLMLNEGGIPQQSLGLLRRHLGHEMLHYYLPNAFNVRENFDWFWEGFTRYAAWLTLTRRNLLDLQGYLDSIGEEYESYYYNPLSAHRSLIAASAEKFANDSMADLVYRKGTLVAALYDLELRRRSKGASSIIDVLRNLYRDYARTGKPIGNSEVIAELARPGDFSAFIRDDIEGVREIDLAERVKVYGLFLEWSRATNGKARITVVPKASAEKKRILDGISRQ